MGGHAYDAAWALRALAKLRPRGRMLIVLQCIHRAAMSEEDGRQRYAVMTENAPRMPPESG